MLQVGTCVICVTFDVAHAASVYAIDVALVVGDVICGVMCCFMEIDDDDDDDDYAY